MMDGHYTQTKEGNLELFSYSLELLSDTEIMTKDDNVEVTRAKLVTPIAKWLRNYV